MVGKEFMDYMSKFKITTYSGVEDFADKFNFLYTVFVLSMCTIIITAKSYLLKPIACYISTEIGGSNLLNYVENYCWVQGTVPISYAGKMPSTDEGWKKLEEQKILYYQWVPFVLGLQCICFYVPRIIWQIICFNQTGTNLENIIAKSMEALQASDEARKNCIFNVATTIEQLLFQQQKKASFNPSSIFSRKKTIQLEQSNIGDTSIDSCNKSKNISFHRLISHRRGTCITGAYIFIKLLYLLNAFGQIFMMQAFLGFHSEIPAFGYNVLRNMIRGHDWQMTQIFPRVGFCFVQMKIVGVQSNGVTAQCALPTNMLNEKIYVFLWWWIVLASVLTTISMVMWFARFCGCSREVDYIIKYIQLADDVVPYDERNAYDFASKFLRRDGIFLMRMVRLNAGDVVAAALINVLWERYMQRIHENTHDPLSNFRLPAVGWAGALEKPEKNGVGAITFRKRPDTETEESLYPPLYSHTQAKTTV